MHTVMRRLPLLVAALAFGAALASCAAHTPAASESPSSRSNRAVIEAAELPTRGTETVYEVIQRLRPEYLRVRPAQTNAGGGASQQGAAATIFANGQMLGDVAELRRIPASTVVRVRHYGIEEGKQKFGMQYGGGIIELTYRQ